MFNIFNTAKDLAKQSINEEVQVATTATEVEQASSATTKAPKHGEDGVCCGGCGGQ